MNNALVNVNLKQQLYETKDAQYYRVLNPGVVSLLEPANSMLDVGCAEGLLGDYAAQHGLFNEMYGIEIHSASASKAKRFYTRVYNTDIESFAFSMMDNADAIVCADVLEHLVDPWTVFARLVETLTNSGYMIVSIPNARHVRVWVPLVLAGRFDYQEWGVLDKGHLRFFTFANLRELFDRNGVYIDRTVWHMAPKGKLLNRLTLGVLKEFCTFQFVFRLRKKL